MQMGCCPVLSTCIIIIIIIEVLARDSIYTLYTPSSMLHDPCSLLRTYYISSPPFPGGIYELRMKMSQNKLCRSQVFSQLGPD